MTSTVADSSRLLVSSGRFTEAGSKLHSPETIKKTTHRTRIRRLEFYGFVIRLLEYALLMEKNDGYKTKHILLGSRSVIFILSILFRNSII